MVPECALFIHRELIKDRKPGEMKVSIEVCVGVCVCQKEKEQLMEGKRMCCLIDHSIITLACEQ